MAGAYLDGRSRGLRSTLALRRIFSIGGGGRVDRGLEVDACGEFYRRGRRGRLGYAHALGEQNVRVPEAVARSPSPPRRLWKPLDGNCSCEVGFTWA